MSMRAFLAENRAQLVSKWVRLVFEAYSSEASRFFNREKDQFANPVGHTLSQGIEILYDHLVQETDFDGVRQSLDDIVRIKAVQDFSPSEAVDFLFRLKRLVREEIQEHPGENGISIEEVLEFESRIDALVLEAFNSFMKCREKIYDLKTNQIQNRVYRLLKRANLVVEIPDPEVDSGDVENAK